MAHPWLGARWRRGPRALVVVSPCMAPLRVFFFTVAAASMLECSTKPPTPERALEVAAGSWVEITAGPGPVRLETSLGARALQPFAWNGTRVVVLPLLIDGNGAPYVGPATLRRDETTLEHLAVRAPLEPQHPHLDEFLELAQQLVDEPLDFGADQGARERGEAARATLRALLPPFRQAVAEARVNPVTLSSDGSSRLDAASIARVEALLEAASRGIVGRQGVKRQELSLEGATIAAVALTTCLFGVEAATVGMAAVAAVIVAVELVLLAEVVVDRASAAWSRVAARVSEVQESLHASGTEVVRSAQTALADVARLAGDTRWRPHAERVRQDVASTPSWPAEPGTPCGRTTCIPEYTTCCPWLGFNACHPPGFSCPPSNVPLRIISGADQAGTRGEVLPEPVVLEVRDALGVALAGVPLVVTDFELPPDLTVVGAGEVVTTNVARCDATGPSWQPCVTFLDGEQTTTLGQARLSWKVSNSMCNGVRSLTDCAAGPKNLVNDQLNVAALVPLGNGSARVYRVTTKARVPRPVVVEAFGENQTARAGASYGAPVGVRVVDQTGAPWPGLTVRFESIVTDAQFSGYGGGMVGCTPSRATVSTDLTGVASTIPTAYTCGDGSSQRPFECAPTPAPYDRHAILWSVDLGPNALTSSGALRVFCVP